MTYDLVLKSLYLQLLRKWIKKIKRLCLYALCLVSHKLILFIHWNMMHIKGFQQCFT